MSQYVQLPDILDRIVTLLFQFIEQPPEANAGMVIQLPDHFLQLLLAILSEALGIYKALVGISSRTHERDLRPCDDTCLVKQVDELIRLWIVREPNRVHSHRPHQSHIFLMISKMERISDLCTLLMTANAV